MTPDGLGPLSSGASGISSRDLQRMQEAKQATSMGLNPNRLSLEPATMKERYQDQLGDAQRRVEKLTEIIAILDKHPEVERLLTLMQGV